MRRAWLALALTLLLAGCSDWQAVAVAIDNDGPATTVEVILDPAEGKTRTFSYVLAANSTQIDHWSIDGGDKAYEVTVRAGPLEARGREEFCASTGFLIYVNATAIRYDHKRGDGFTGC